MASIWDERFAGEGYVYGTAPNTWLEAQASRLKAGSRILSLGEGEGRNAVWLATQGHRIEAVDGSSIGLEKAQRLAATRGVTIQATVADLATFVPAPGAYDAVVLIFVHLSLPLRALVHARAQAALAPGGVLVIEAFTPRQLAFTSGGPKQVEALYEPETLRQDFPGIAWDVLREEEIELDEGPLHRGKAAVVRGLGRRTGS
jgi:cyclopropane fatty-acyl-phospholipid synthase-like methyltransferase